MIGDSLLNLAGIAFAASWTPGPNNVMLAASGATFGWRRTLPHAMGISFGFPFMLGCVGLGLGQVFQALPWLKTAMLWIGFAVMLWLAWRIATARRSDDGSETTGRPLSFWQASAFQWINPKAWAFAIGVSATFIGLEAPITDAAIAVVVFLLAALTSTQGWSLFGTAMGRFLARGQRLRVFNAFMGLLLAACAVWMLMDG